MAHIDARNSDGSGSIDRDEFLQIPQIASNPLALRMIAIFDEECVCGLWFFSSSCLDDILTLVTNRSSMCICCLQRRRNGRLPRIRWWVECIQQSRWPRRKIKMYVYLECSVYILFIHLIVWSSLAVAFKVYDVDRDGYISNGELFLVLKMMVGNNLKVCIISYFVTCI